MVGIFFHFPVKLLYFKIICCQNIINAQSWREVRISSSYTETFFKESILQAIFNGEIGIRIRHIVQVTGYYIRIGRTLNFIFHNVCLPGTINKTGF